MEFNISDAEMKIMRVLWAGGAADAEEVNYQVKDQKWAYSTVKTFLSRLVKKGMLSSEKNGNRLQYSPKLSECDAIEKMSASLLEKACQTKHGELISDLLKSATLSANDIGLLEELLSEKRPQETVVCDCMVDFDRRACQHQGEEKVSA